MLVLRHAADLQFSINITRNGSVNKETSCVTRVDGTDVLMFLTCNVKTSAGECKFGRGYEFEAPAEDGGVFKMAADGVAATPGYSFDPGTIAR